MLFLSSRWVKPEREGDNKKRERSIRSSSSGSTHGARVPLLADTAVRSIATDWQRTSQCPTLRWNGRVHKTLVLF